MNLHSPYERLLRPAFFPLVMIIFTASGFAGLIYQSIWSHYIKLFLGHAAYAQSLVLAIFMGGMALGAWLASRWSTRWRDLLLAYAVAEALIGIASLVFHTVFVESTQLAFDHVIPALGSPGAVHAFKWTLAAALILPQSILLGMTFPLMTGGVLRLQPQRSGYVIAMLYFTNSLGAAIGVLASGFYLIEAAGLPGTLAAAASVNLAVAAAAILLPRKAPLPAPQAEPGPRQVSPRVPRLRLLLAVSALTGLSSFMYEIGWIRMLSLVLGSSTHAFELMLSAFILGIAFGGLWIRRRIDAAGDAMRLLGIVQVVMGLAALATLPVYGMTFNAMRAALDSLAATEGGYAAFNLISHGICLAVMFPAAFCAGMTLPLITVCLLRQGSGERAIGQVYAANTLGAIAGVLLAVHVGLPMLGLKGLIIAGAAIDLALGVVLLGVAPVRLRMAFAGGALAVSAAGVLFAALGVHLDPHQMASGVYRLGILMDPQRNKIVHYEDGKTSTVSVTQDKTVLSLRNNGKSDGSLNSDLSGPPTGDEPTMGLLGTLPILINPDARLAANIGFGTGLTAHALLASERLERLDTIEIEPAVVRAARQFLPHNVRAYEDPRSRIHIEDAKTFFSTHQTRYDIIVSEPSNPWVSGVASLFSSEFYVHARRHLKERGLFVQWVQLYEFSPQLLASVLEALRPVFSDYVLWLSNDGDLIVVAANGGRVPEPQAAALGNPRVAEVLERFAIRSMDDLLLHRVGSRAAMDPYFTAFGAEANSDFFPLVDLNAAKARFMRTEATATVRLTEAPFPVLDLFDPGHAPDPTRLTRRDGHVGTKRRSLILQAEVAREFMLGGDARHLSRLSSEFAGQLTLLRATMLDCRLAAPSGLLPMPLFDLARLTNGFLPGAQAAAIWQRLEASPCKARLDPSTRRWLRLHAAVAARQPVPMAEAAAAVLKAEPDLRPDTRSYAVAVLMAGRTLAGETALAAKAFQQYRAALRPDRQWQPVFTLLNGHALGPIRGEPVALK
jgi:predicted membrane-bound spermidine synthase